jgi:hypothetical protein
MDNQWVIDFYSQEHWDLVLLERDSKLASFCGLRTRSALLMLSRIGMVFGGYALRAMSVDFLHNGSSVAFVAAMALFGLALYSWLTNMELAREK